jgi:tetratricopeptide (TPR) repeat protein
MLRANLYVQGKYKDPALAVKYATECLKKNRPDFDIEKIPDYFLSSDELVLISLLAMAYKELEGLPTAIDIWQKLRANYEKNYKAEVTADLAYRDLLSNITLALRHAGRFEECLEMAEKGLALSLAYHDMRAYSRYLHQKAWCLMKLGRRQEGEEWYVKFLLFAYVLDGYAAINFQTVVKEYQDTFGGELRFEMTFSK